MRMRDRRALRSWLSVPLQSPPISDLVWPIFFWQLDIDYAVFVPIHRKAVEEFDVQLV